LSNQILAPGDTDYLSSLLQRVRASRMARQAAWLFGLNTLAKGLVFLGSAYAAKCLGPANLGISAMIISLGQLVVVLVGGGLDTVAVRHIAANPSAAGDITRAIVAFRWRMLAVILPLGLGGALWLTPGEQALAWGVGALIPIVTSFSLLFVFQGLEKLPMQAMVSVLTSTLAALAFSLFHPGMPMGSDLVVLAASGVIGVSVNVWLFHRLTSASEAKVSIPGIGPLLLESRPYWILAVVVYCYSSLQVPLVGYMTGKESLGVYRSALMLAAGLELFYNSVNSLLLPRLVVWSQQGPAYLWRRQKELLVIFLLVGGVVSTSLILLAPLIYRRLLGVEFSDAVLPFQILVVGRLVVFLGKIFAWSLTALHLDRQFLGASISGAFFSVLANLLVLPRFGITGAAVISLATEIIVCSLCLYFVLTHRKKSI